MKKDNYNNTVTNYPTLTTENAHTASTVICLEHPEWGFKRFNYESNNNSSVGVGSNSKMLPECEYKYWGIASVKDDSQVNKRLEQINIEITNTFADNSVENAAKWARLQKERTALNNLLVRKS